MTNFSYRVPESLGHRSYVVYHNYCALTNQLVYWLADNTSMNVNYSGVPIYTDAQNSGNNENK